MSQQHLQPVQAAEEKKQDEAPAFTPQHYNFPKGQKTPGEKLFDYTLYGGIGYFLNLGLSLVITEFMLFGKGRKAWDASDKALQGVLKNFMHHDTAKSASETTQKYFWLTSGGTVLMVPIKLAEDNKSKITYLLNRAYFPDVLPTDDPYKNLTSRQILSSQFDENLLPQPVIEQPKNSWLNAAMRRVFAVALVSLGWGNLTEKLIGNDRIEAKSYDIISKSAKSMGATDELIKNPRFERYAKWTVIDGINTVITSLAIYLTSGAEKKKPEHHVEVPHIIPADPEKPTHHHKSVKPAVADSSPHPSQQLVAESVQRNASPSESLEKRTQNEKVRPASLEGYAAAMEQQKAAQSADLHSAV